MENELFRNEWMVLLMMLYGAFGFYVGIDLPSRLAQTAKFTRPEEWTFGTDAAAMASVAGTFFAAIAVFLSVGIIVLDHTVRDGFSVLVACCWAIGTSFQIAAGAIGRRRLSSRMVVGNVRCCASQLAGVSVVRPAPTVLRLSLLT